MIQRVIGKIADGEIHSAEMVHRISQIVREQGHALSDMIYDPAEPLTKNPEIYLGKKGIPLRDGESYKKK